MSEKSSALMSKNKNSTNSIKKMATSESFISTTPEQKSKAAVGSTLFPQENVMGWNIFTNKN